MPNRSRKVTFRNNRGFAHLILVLVLGVFVVLGLVLASGDGLGVFAGKGRGGQGGKPKPPSEPRQSVTVQAPNGGETYEEGQVVEVKWTVGDFKQYSQENSSVWLATRSTQSDGTYVYQNKEKIAEGVKMRKGKNSLDWIIPDSILNGGSYVIYVAINLSAPNFDYSDSTFTIINELAGTPPPQPISFCDDSTGRAEVVDPNGDEAYEAGDTILLKWCLNSYGEYSQADSSIWLATRSTQSDGTFVYQNQALVSDETLMVSGENTLNWLIPEEYVIPSTVPEEPDQISAQSGLECSLHFFQTPNKLLCLIKQPPLQTQWQIPILQVCFHLLEQLHLCPPHPQVHLQVWEQLPLETLLLVLILTSLQFLLPHQQFLQLLA